MTPRHSILLAFILATSCFTSSCSEKSRASVRALHNQAEDELVAKAGEGRVALELAKNQYQAYKEKLVNIKSQMRSHERRAGQLEAQARQMEEAGKPEEASQLREQAATNRDLVKKLSRKELSATEALKSYSVYYPKLEEQVTLLEEELESLKAIGGLGDDLGVGNPSEARIKTIRDLVKTMERNVDRAEAIIEVHEIEEGL